MNRNNAVAQNELLPAASSGRMFPTTYANGIPTYWLFRWGSGAPPVAAPDARMYFRTDGNSPTTMVYIDNGSGAWAALTIN